MDRKPGIENLLTALFARFYLFPDILIMLFDFLNSGTTQKGFI
jgi:hypothetical protein